MGRNKKLTKATRERMARTGENYTTARTALLTEEPPREPFRALTVDDVDPGTGAVAESWCRLHVRYEIRQDDRVLDWTGERAKVFALRPDHAGWMSTLVGLRVGGLRRIEGDFRLWGRCAIEARLMAVEPYVPVATMEVVGSGRQATHGARVRVHYQLFLLDPMETQIATSDQPGMMFEVGCW